MNELTVIIHKNIEVVDSREVAEMLERNHKELLRDIHKYIEIISNAGGERKIAPSDFFIPSTYISSQNKEQPCYLLTKKGCDMVANKMTGEKGVLFTAAYVTAFESMRGQITLALPKDYPTALRALAAQVEETQKLQAENEIQRQAIADFQPRLQYLDTILASPGTMATSQIAADYDMSARQLNKILQEEHIQRNVYGQWILYREHMGKGYTKSETIPITRSDGRPDTKMNTRWTQKGRIAIHEILTKRDIKAAMDKEIAS